jgi:hypothetical protein
VPNKGETMKMKASQTVFRSGPRVSPWSRLPRPLMPLVVGMGAAILVASCSSPSAMPTSIHPAASGPFLHRSGTGDMTLTSTMLPSKWTVNWTFDCNSPTKAGTFVLSTTRRGGTSTDVTDQTGLGGSGHKPFTKSGNYAFAVKTTCGWKVAVGTTPAGPAKLKAKAATGTSTDPTS